MAIPIDLVRDAKTEFDLTEEADQQSLYTLTEALLDILNAPAPCESPCENKKRAG